MKSVPDESGGRHKDKESVDLHLKVLGIQMPVILVPGIERAIARQLQPQLNGVS